MGPYISCKYIEIRHGPLCLDKNEKKYIDILDNKINLKRKKLQNSIFYQLIYSVIINP